MATALQPRLTARLSMISRVRWRAGSIRALSPAPGPVTKCYDAPGRGTTWTMRRLTLSKGKQALLDDDDYDLVSEQSWCATEHSHTWYAIRFVRWRDDRGRPKKTGIYLHRFIMNAPARKEVVHLNGDGLDCRRENLRISTRTEANAMRRADYKKAEGSKYRGVYRARATASTKPWYAAISIEHKTVHLGRFVTEEAAARAYDAAAIQHLGDAAKLNLRRAPRPRQTPMS
jgi:HNH endonuclease/AP2 domain